MKFCWKHHWYSRNCHVCWKILLVGMGKVKKRSSQVSHERFLEFWRWSLFLMNALWFLNSTGNNWKDFMWSRQSVILLWSTEEEFYSNKIILVLTIPVEPKKSLQSVMGSKSCLIHHIVQTSHHRVTNCFDLWSIFFRGKKT